MLGTSRLPTRCSARRSRWWRSASIPRRRLPRRCWFRASPLSRRCHESRLSAKRPSDCAAGSSERRSRRRRRLRCADAGTGVGCRSRVLAQRRHTAPRCRRRRHGRCQPHEHSIRDRGLPDLQVRLALTRRRWGVRAPQRPQEELQVSGAGRVSMLDRLQWSTSRASTNEFSLGPEAQAKMGRPAAPRWPELRPRICPSGLDREDIDRLGERCV